MKYNKLIIVEGHQYPNGDPGAIAKGTTEARQNVEVGDETVKLFRNVKTLEVLHCPQDLGGVAEIAWVNAHADSDTIVVSIHHNASKDANASGVEAYHYKGNADGQELARIICGKISEKTGIYNRGAKIESQSQHNHIGIISRTKGTAVLVECGFMTNPYDKNHILNPDLDNAFSEAIFDGVTEFLGKELKNKIMENINREKLDVIITTITKKVENKSKSLYTIGEQDDIKKIVYGVLSEIGVDC